MSIEIVSHCFAQRFPHYAKALIYQLSSLVLHPPKRCKVTATVCFDMYGDATTWKVLQWFEANTDLPIKLIHLDLPYLGRRCIGRNLAARTSEADVVWFTDVDYVFQEGCLDTLIELEWPEGSTMIFPSQVMIHREHTTGDKAFERVEGPELVEIDKSEFVPKRCNKAIGGIQIVQGGFARSHGYLDGDAKWQKPVSDGRFHACKCDVPYRQFCGSVGVVGKVDLPGVYRMRHTQAAHGRAPRL